MKKLISVVLSVLIAFSAFGVVAYAEEAAEPLAFEVNEEGYAVLVFCDPAVEGEVVVPSLVEIEDEIYEVKYIGENAFEGCELITTIVLSKGIEQIGDMAFLNCTALKDLYIPETLLFCAYTAFNGTQGVTVHCYSANYQFFTVFGVIQNLRIDIIDSVGDDLDLGIGSIGSIDLMNTIILVIKRLIQFFLYFSLNFGTDAEIEEVSVKNSNSAVRTKDIVSVL